MLDRVIGGEEGQYSLPYNLFPSCAIQSQTHRGPYIKRQSIHVTNLAATGSVSDVQTTHSNMPSARASKNYEILRFGQRLSINIAVLCNVTPCSLVPRYKCFGRTYCFNLPGARGHRPRQGGNRLLRNASTKLHGITRQKTVTLFIIVETRPICPLFKAISVLMSDWAVCRKRPMIRVQFR